MLKLNLKKDQIWQASKQQHLVSYKLEIYGQVQGVGFRPFVVKLARQHSLTGWVSNCGGWVEILISGSQLDCQQFLEQLQAHPPAQAKIKKITVTPVSYQPKLEFKVKTSKKNYSRLIYLPVDFALCLDCLKEIKDIKNKRFAYAFNSCVNCGPRFSILKALPYDRHQTTMQSFSLCLDCKREYEDITNTRRYLAETVSCPNCGPVLTWEENGQKFGQLQIALRKAATALLTKKVIAVKGIGGYHLVALAASQEAIAKIKQFKQRPDKPLAVMFKDLKQLKEYLKVNLNEKAKLTSAAAPIVIIKANSGTLVSITNAKQDKKVLAKEVYSPQQTLGVFLAYTPLHYLLLDAVRQPLVVTSANKGEEPIVYQDQAAVEQLQPVVDGYLQHNRQIMQPLDDAVVKKSRRHWLLLRTGRGFVPTVISLPLEPKISKRTLPELLAVGGDLKNSFCLVKNGFAYLSQYHGDLASLACRQRWQENLKKWQNLLNLKPKGCVVDLHPDYVSRGYAQQLKLPLIEVQHHHAHIASCLAEKNVTKPVLGVAFDGTGYGLDGTIWGGEWLLADLKSFKRLAHFAYYQMPGVELAIKQPWRLAVSFLAHSGFSLGEIKTMLSSQTAKSLAYLETVYRQWELKLNSPLSSAASRLFEAVSALVGVCWEQTYEGQAASYLEAVAEPGKSFYRYQVNTSNLPFVIDWRPLFKDIVSDLKKGTTSAIIAGRFHLTIAHIIADVCLKLREKVLANAKEFAKFKLGEFKKVVLAGGVFQNALLVDLTEDLLLKAGFEVLINEKVPVNDGGLSLGQAAIGLSQQIR